MEKGMLLGAPSGTPTLLRLTPSFVRRGRRAICAPLSVALFRLLSFNNLTFKSYLVFALGHTVGALLRFATHFLLCIGCISTCLLDWWYLWAQLLLRELAAARHRLGLMANKGKVRTWIIGFRNRFPWLVERPPNSFDFKHVFVVSGGLIVVLWRRIEGYQILVLVWAFTGLDGW